MKIYPIIIIILFAFPLTSNSQDINYKEYSYTQFISLVQEEEDSLFTLENALIRFNPYTDTLFVAQRLIDTNRMLIAKRTDYLEIDKELVLNGVHFENPIFINRESPWQHGYLSKIHFKKKVTINDCAAIHFVDCLFDNALKIRGSGFSCTEIARVDKELKLQDRIEIDNCTFKNGLNIFFNCNFQDEILQTYLSLSNNIIYKNAEISDSTSLSLTGHSFGNFSIINNQIMEKSRVIINNSGKGLFINKNNFGPASVQISATNPDGVGRLIITKNIFNRPVILFIENISSNALLEWGQFQPGIISAIGWFSYMQKHVKDSFDVNTLYNGQLSDSLTENYLNKSIFINKEAYEEELALRGKFRDYFRSRYLQESANEVYIATKNLETGRLQYLYQQNPSFPTLFKWQINRFLNVFSNYGTEPSKSIVFSFYVVLFFAMIYLFFPNSWDEHGRNRIIDRYKFFFKYMKKDAGAHEVYLEEKAPEMMTYNEFKNTILNSEKKVPRFFTATALPLYYWAISGIQFRAHFLNKIDVMQGKWEDLPMAKKSLKTFLLIGAFILAFIYDLGIKMLNALMLSLNTFTTLGFGEIPIRGLPRYLAIIQGFIGWFMLTIFSVSLISQLLN